MTLRAPFPYYGGKRRWAEAILARLEPVTVYVEPFAGSLAVLLASEPHDREIVCDTSGHICNFWRALRGAPDEVAYWADYPTYHQDLTARHDWLIRWAREHAARLSEDPDYCDAKAAGWWVWGISLWIGGGWCADGDPSDKRPHVNSDTVGGQGVTAQRRTLGDQRPYIADRPGGQGVQAQARGDTRLAKNQIPHMSSTPGGRGVAAQRALIDRTPQMNPSTGGRGVSAQRDLVAHRDQIPHASTLGGQGVAAQRPLLGDSGGGTGSRLRPWFEALAERLSRVVVLNRSWESAVTPTVLMHTRTGPKPPVGVLLDPPYRTDTGRSKKLYSSDYAGDSDDVAHAAYLWAVEHGETYKIAYCCHDGDYDTPPGWEKSTRPLSVGAKRDCLFFSPACNRTQLL